MESNGRGIAMFTFVVMSYNQEEFVIDNLESIKYQIENFGDGIDVDLVFSDDCSTDNTVAYAELWLQENQHLFRDITVIVNEENLGIVKNYLLATGAVKTPYCKVLGADDLYHRNNVFEIMDVLAENQILFSPTLTFSQEGVSVYWDINNLLNIHSKKSVENYLEHGYPFNTGGMFYQAALVQNPGLREYISKYTWIEDLPSVYYMFNHIEDFNFAVYYKPLMIYRNTVGISNNEEHGMNQYFTDEERQIKREIGMKEFKKGLNLNYFRVAFLYKYFSLRSAVIPEKRELKREIYKETEVAQEHIRLIAERAKEFSESMLQMQ